MPAAKQQQPRLPWAGLALTISGMIYQGGVLSNRVTQNELRIAELRATNTNIWNKLNDMNIREEKNATKLDFLVEEALSDTPANKKVHSNVR